MGTVMLSCALADVAAAEAAPPAPIVRKVPPGMEDLERQRAAEATPKPDAYWRGGLTLHVGAAVGSFIAARSTTDRVAGTNVSFAIGGFPASRLAVYLQLESTVTDKYASENAHDLGFVGLTADYFVTDRVLVGGGLGQATTELPGLYDDEEVLSLAAQARMSFVVTQWRKHAFDLTGAVTTARFEKTQVTAINLGVGYRLF
ncbi:MAG TPA: hypothetical protein VM261_28755 [Kofleriaceae bacterium]|nr:hypothetical protein [Kofleriaceae bacterium]